MRVPDHFLPHDACDAWGVVELGRPDRDDVVAATAVAHPPSGAWAS